MADIDSSGITDSTDWLSTPLSGFSAVESGLRCRVCRDFYKTPMLTTCLHTFCSVCIRRSLANDGKCPACRAPEQESKLRWVGALDDVVDAFVKVRSTMLSFASARVEESGQSPKRKLEREPIGDGSDDAPRKRLRSSARLSRTRGEEATTEMMRHEINVIEDSADEEYEENRDDGLTPCPICNRRMKEWQVYSHLDKCPGSSAEPPQSSSRELPTSTNFLNPSPRKQQTKLERLPALNYSILKDQAMRKKMTELGISSSGSRALLERRHREWCTIWNANCDSVKPKSRPQLMHDLEVWERAQGGRTQASRLAQNSTSVRDKDFDGRAWATKYSSSFEGLIANARKNRQPKQEPARVEEVPKVSDVSVEDVARHEQGVTDTRVEDAESHEPWVIGSAMEAVDSFEQGVIETAVGGVDSHEQDTRDTAVGSVDCHEQRIIDTAAEGVHCHEQDIVGTVVDDAVS